MATSVNSTPSTETDSLPPTTDGESALILYNFAGSVHDADVVLRTTDDVELHAHQLILRRVSPVLASCIDSAISGSSRPRIQLPAEARIVDMLLTHLYPEYEPEETAHFDDLLALMHLAFTYQIQAVVTRLRKELVKEEFLYAHPIRVFSAATSWDLEREASLAAEASGILDLSTLSPEDLRGVSAVDYVRLVKLHKRRRAEILQAVEFWLSRRCKTCQHSNSWAAQFRARAVAEVQRRPSTKVIFGEDFMGRNAAAGACSSCDLHFAFVEGWKELVEMCRPDKIQYFIPRPRTISPTDSLSSLSPIPSFEEGDIILRSSDGIQLRAYKRILMEASVFFKALFDLPQQCESETDESLPIIDCQEDSITLQKLLQLIYPVPNPDFRNVDEVQPVLEAANKFEVDAAMAALVSVLRSPRMLASDPVRIYALACRYSLPSLSRAAAAACLRVDLDETGEMSVVGLSAESFTRLLNWRNLRGAQIRKLLSDQSYGHVCQVCRDRWTSRWLGLALFEVSKRPVGELIFSLEFVMQAMDMERATWQSMPGHYCGNSVTEGDREWMRTLRARVMELPEEMEL
ncbi:hypothetical protein CALVIDRAFT_536331 [Calocera viscosa TUFC12733]|uniref:BTB domain-containing protein n=1 Tax=Calocera viscosa (strain TUFC12733) TaxID=1330018 RepID=A0A167N3L5_CALVF|nr:hypothetical protein CALVIDRAFT_536331 [Calocera viscosa TUFC12733]